MTRQGAAGFCLVLRESETTMCLGSRAGSDGSGHAGAPLPCKATGPCGAGPVKKSSLPAATGRNSFPLPLIHCHVLGSCGRPAGEGLAGVGLVWKSDSGHGATTFAQGQHIALQGTITFLSFLPTQERIPQACCGIQMLPKPGSAQAWPKLASPSPVLSSRLPLPALPAAIQGPSPTLQAQCQCMQPCPHSPLQALSCAAMTITTVARDHSSSRAAGSRSGG